MTIDLQARQADLLRELESLQLRARFGYDGVWENERRRVIHLELSAIDAERAGRAVPLVATAVVGGQR